MKKILCLVFVWVVGVVAITPPLAQHTVPGVEGKAGIRGRVLEARGRIRVLAYHLSSGQMFRSEPTRERFELTGLPYGYFDLAVETPDGLYVASQVVNVPPSGTAVLILALAPFRASTSSLARPFPTREEEPSGLAEVRKKLRGREYWRSPAGVAILSGIGGVALLALALGADDEDAATTTNPN